MKKIILYLLCFILMLGINPSRVALSDDENEENLFVDITTLEKTVPLKLVPPKLNAISAIALDFKTGRVLYEKNARRPMAMASTTKIMTAIIAIEKGKLDSQVAISKRASQVGGSEINLREGEKITLKELLYGLMLRSGNDAAVAIAEHIGGSVEGFCNIMNQKALELGANNTHFTSPHGLDMPEHYTTAYELAKITSYALQNSLFNQLVSTKNYKITGRELFNTNELLGSYPGTDGVKTGYTGQAGRCLVTSATRNEQRVITVVLGCPTRTARAQSSSNLLNYSFTNYKEHTLAYERENITVVPIEKGIATGVRARVNQSISMPMRNDEIAALERIVTVKTGVKAPVSEGTELGSVKWMCQGNMIAQTSLFAADNVRKKNIGDIFKDIAGGIGKIFN